MSWNYRGSPAGSERDTVRFMVGDTDTTDQLITDEEIAWCIERGNGVNIGAAIACDAISAKFSRLVDGAMGGERGIPHGI